MSNGKLPAGNSTQKSVKVSGKLPAGGKGTQTSGAQVKVRWNGTRYAATKDLVGSEKGKKTIEEVRGLNFRRKQSAA